ncbi:hypothetical protein L3Q82_014049 [Scortum barcoo]|uniref:Uncharacterized protein n=1 Tax=Scortum barcoo TaxID=214431 RepID=A0ACB8VVC3_9TELE|nr:hypothetical protein L3Q82_014049 [Scortum barcoo]
MADRRTFNVVILGVGFLFIFTAFTTCGNIEQTVVKSLQNDTFTGSGYHSLGIIYGVFSFSKFACTDSRCSNRAENHLVFERPTLQWVHRCLHHPHNMVLVLDLGADWHCGSHAVDSSRTLSGGKLRGVHHQQEHRDVLGSLTVQVWTPVFQSIRFPRYKHRADTAIQDAKSELKTILQLLKAKNILLLSPCMAYSGLELSFYSGVYGTCIGATTQFGEAAKGLIGISGIVVGVGEIVGGGLFGLLCKNNRFRRTSVVFLGMVVHFVAFYLIFLNIPDDAPVVFDTTSQKRPYLNPSVSIALLCSFLLGLGDSCFNTQLYSILGCVYAEHSTPAFAIFKFIQSVFAAVAFFYSGYLLLMWQLLLMVILGFAGTLCFFVVERMENFSADLQEY